MGAILIKSNKGQNPVIWVIGLVFVVIVLIIVVKAMIEINCSTDKSTIQKLNGQIETLGVDLKNCEREYNALKQSNLELSTANSDLNSLLIKKNERILELERRLSDLNSDYNDLNDQYNYYLENNISKKDFSDLNISMVNYINNRIQNTYNYYFVLQIILNIFVLFIYLFIIDIAFFKANLCEKLFGKLRISVKNKFKTEVINNTKINVKNEIKKEDKNE